VKERRQQKRRGGKRIDILTNKERGGGNLKRSPAGWGEKSPDSKERAKLRTFQARTEEG